MNIERYAVYAVLFDAAVWLPASLSLHTSDAGEALRRWAEVHGVKLTENRSQCDVFGDGVVRSWTVLGVEACITVHCDDYDPPRPQSDMPAEEWF